MIDFKFLSNVQISAITNYLNQYGEGVFGLSSINPRNLFHDVKFLRDDLVIATDLAAKGVSILQVVAFSKEQVDEFKSVIDERDEAIKAYEKRDKTCSTKLEINQLYDRRKTALSAYRDYITDAAMCVPDLERAYPIILVYSEDTGLIEAVKSTLSQSDEYISIEYTVRGRADLQNADCRLASKVSDEQLIGLPIKAFGIGV